jgi:hypothetical protein
MYLEKNNSPGRIINLDHVASMDWDKELSVEFILANGQTVTWRYKTEEEQMEDLDKVGKLLHRTHKLISFELDQE